MPKAYESMRDKFAKGAAKDSPEYDAAQSKAAAIYNSKHKDAPVTGKHSKKKKVKKGYHRMPDGSLMKDSAMKSKKTKPASRGGIAEDIFGKE